MAKKYLKLALYDFDGTVYDGDSYIDLWFFTLKKSPWRIIFVFYQLILFFLWKLEFISFNSFKEKFLIFFLSGKNSTIIKSFWKKNSVKIFPWFYSAIVKDKEQGLYPICITASLDIIVEDLAKELGFEAVISTETNFKKKFLKLITKNCSGKQKVERLYLWAEKNNIKFDVIKTYSDSIQDLPIYDLALEKYYIDEIGKLSRGIAFKKKYF